MIHPEQIFTEKVVQALFPPERTHDFFDALFGDANEGAYDIALSFDGYNQASQVLSFLLNLHERPGRCLACNLTSGLPQVFSRHPVVNVKGLVEEIEKLLAGTMVCESWKLEHTIQKGRSLHCIPLQIQLRQP